MFAKTDLQISVSLEQILKTLFEIIYYDIIIIFYYY